MKKDIIYAFKEYEEYKRTKVDCYKIIKQLGDKGKEGVTYLVVDNKGKEYAMKTFKKNKSSRILKHEVNMQDRASKAGIAPIIIDVNTVGKTIVMEKMDCHLIERRKSKKLTIKQQQNIIVIYKKLDQVGVFHGDSNILNYMYKGNKLYIIDYGFSKIITTTLIKKLGTNTPNLTIMTLGMILKLLLKCGRKYWD